MSRRALRSAQHGWSLVELAVALSIAGLLTALLFTLLPLGKEVVEADLQQRELAEAEQALLGYMRVRGSLPPADSDGDGRSDPGSEGSWLPVRDLGLPSRMRIRYQVHSSLGASPGDLFHPLLPVIDQHPPVVNALDFCMRLLLNQRGNVSMAGMGMPLAYYLGHSGYSGGRRIDALAEWNESGQPLPGTGDAISMAVVAAGPGELASRLGCPDRLARAQGSAQGAQAAHSALRMTEFNLEFREFDIKIAETTLAQAEASLGLAAYAMAEAITNEAIAITLMASGWPPDGITIAAGVKQLAESILSIVQAARSLASAVNELDEAKQGLEDTKDNRNHVRTYRDRIRLLYQDATLHTTRMDREGLNQ